MSTEGLEQLKAAADGTGPPLRIEEAMLLVVDELHETYREHMHLLEEHKVLREEYIRLSALLDKALKTMEGYNV